MLRKTHTFIHSLFQRDIEQPVLGTMFADAPHRMALIRQGLADVGIAK